ncbi:MAG: BatA domain-containing protein, partial [Pseudomonadota bacterium]
MAGFTFAAPLMLGALITLPLIWWLLRAMPPAPLRMPFGGTIFLEGLSNKKETPAKTPWWMLLIRLAALGLLILGLSGPV